LVSSIFFGISLVSNRGIRNLASLLVSKNIPKS